MTRVQFALTRVQSPTRQGGEFTTDVPTLISPLRRALRRLPPLEGASIRISRKPGLRGRYGPSHGGALLRQRQILLDCTAAEFPRIFAHELFHFVWLRAGNPVRISFERMIARELAAAARGELGWSAEMLKERLKPADWRNRTRRWREYCCEAFCDTAAWLYSGVRRHAEFTLAKTCRKTRREWFAAAFGRRRLPI